MKLHLSGAQSWLAVSSCHTAALWLCAPPALQFAVNTLAGFALTVALQPALHAAAAARVIFVSSGGQVRLSCWL